MPATVPHLSRPRMASVPTGRAVQPVFAQRGGLSAPRSQSGSRTPPEWVFGQKVIGAVLAGALMIGSTGGGSAEECNCGKTGNVDGFHAVTVLTGDADWEEKWQTIPSEEGVRFGEVTALRDGERAWLLTFFANPEIKEGRFEVLCDLKITRANGTEVMQPQYPCASEVLMGKVDNVRLTSLIVEVVAEPSDPKGIWTAELGVTDAHRGVRVPLSLSFEMLAGGVMQ